MNFLDNLVLPQSAEHLKLLNYLLGLSLIVLVPYFSVLLGFTFLSSSFFKKELNDNNDDNIKLSKLLIDTITFNKVIVFGFGLIPLLSVALIEIQILYLNKINIEYYFLVSILAFLISVIYIYVFKHYLSLYLITEKVSNKSSESNDNAIIKEFKDKSLQINKKYPVLGYVFLLISLYFFNAAINLATNYSSPNFNSNVISVLFSFNTIISFLSFLSFAALLTFSVLLVLLKNNEHIFSKGYFNNLVSFGLKYNIIAVVTYLVLNILKLVSTPFAGLSYDYFLLFVLLVFVLLIVANQTYLMLKNKSLTLVNSTLFFIIIVLTLAVVQNTSAFSISTAKEVNNISEKYLVYQDEFKQSLGIATVVINGEDIYKGKCIACHAFDKRVVGPPYNEVLVKYEGKLDNLVKFILNPVKVNPDYPAMPNQGVKPAEAKAVAEYILSTYKK